MSLLEWLLAFTVVVLGLWLVSVMPSRRHEELEIELNKLRDTNETHLAMVLHRDDRIEQLWKCVQQLDRDIEQYKTASLEYERLAGERAEEIRKLKSERDKFSNAMVQAKRCLTVEISSRDVMNSGKSVEVVSEDVLNNRNAAGLAPMFVEISEHKFWEKWLRAFGNHLADDFGRCG